MVLLYCIQWASIFDANNIVSATLACKVATELILVIQVQISCRATIVTKVLVKYWRCLWPMQHCTSV